MPNPIVREFNTTRVEYSLITIENGVPAFVPQPAAVFSGLLSEKQVQTRMKKLLGENVQYVILSTDAAHHKFAMSFEDFIRHAKIVDGQDIAEAGEEEDEGEAESDGEETSAPQPVPAPASQTAPTPVAPQPPVQPQPETPVPPFAAQVAPNEPKMFVPSTAGQEPSAPPQPGGPLPM